MKPHLILSVLLLLSLQPLFSQSKKQEFSKKTIAGGNGNRTSNEVPRSFMVISNNNYTFIKDSLNHLMAVSHGYDDTRLECINCNIIQEKTTLDYIVYTPNSGECKISIFGINSKTKKEACLGQYRFDIADSVYHDIYIDNILSGNTITNKIATINCKNRDYWNYDEGDIEILTWSIKHRDKEVNGTGNEISKEAINFIKAAPSGESIIITVKAKSNFQKPFVAKGIFLKSE